MTPTATDLLVIVDVQKDFLPGGALAVADGNAVVPVINALSLRFANIVATQDWHTPGHVSFASSHKGQEPFSTIKLSYGEQVMWPDHCVMGTRGAAFAPGLDLTRAQLIIRKGYHPQVDSYSAFQEADGKTPTGLESYLRERSMRRLFVCGLATDFCVSWTALDAAEAGFETFVVEDACRGIDQNGSLAAAWAKMETAGVKRIAAAEVAG